MSRPDEDDMFETEITVHCPDSGCLTHVFIANAWDTNEILLAFAALHHGEHVEVESGPYHYEGAMAGEYIAWANGALNSIVGTEAVN